MSDGEVLFMFVTPNSEGTARNNSEWLFMLREIFCIKICGVLHYVMQFYSYQIAYVTPQGAL
jgi:hypothetical protein